MTATALVVGMIALNIGNTISQRNSILAKGAVDASIARSDARIARIQAANAISRGERRVGTLILRREQLSGTQRANLAAQGIDPSSGTGAAVIIESRLFGDLDILETRNNARLEAFGLKAQALTSDGRARFARLNARAEARQTLLTGASAIARDLALFGSSKSKTRTLRPIPRTATEARFSRQFKRTGSTAGGSFIPGQTGFAASLRR